MRFLADESCDFSVIRASRAEGHDVVAVAEVSPRAEDDTVIELARHEGRLLLTEDKDFGQLVYAHQQTTGGVLLLRFPAPARAQVVTSVVQLVRIRGEELVGRFIVVQPGRIRMGPRLEE